MKKLIFASFLFVIMLLPYSSFSGTMPTIPPVNPGCCQYSGEINSCVNVAFPRCPPPPFGSVLENFFPGEDCNANVGLCGGVSPVTKNVPTMSEWGLIAMAAVLGIIGYMLLRRRKAEV